MSISTWQKRLSEHFRNLRALRSARGNRPIFALEHGLTQSEINELEAEVRNEIKESYISNAYWLPWIVYASEIGYLYEGEEYWQTFEKLTPKWTINGNREYIRKFFLAFSKHFNGAIPTGDWARQFSIICWPITHAILPQDLQFHLAKVLYDLRYRFSSEYLEDPKLLGEQIAAHSFNTNSRFINFSQEHLLVGQIAAALLFKEEQLQTQLILPKTLQRITQDLDKERRSREWLRDARKHAHKVELKGLQKGRSGNSRPRPVEAEKLQEEIVSLGIEPRLILRPTSGSWDIILEIPDLSPLLARFPSLSAVLNSRCRIAGSATRSPRPLHGSQRVVLKEWPTAEMTLLQFEIPSPELSFLFSGECLLRPGPTWLFKVSSDGFAYEMRSRVVRPEGKYILLYIDGYGQQNSKFTPISINCSGINAVLFEIPDFITHEWQELLNILDLDPARTLTIWPSGLPAAAWDGEGRVEWMTYDTPCLAIRADHAVSNISLELNGHNEFKLDLTQQDSSSICYLSLPSLMPGLNYLNVSVNSLPPNPSAQFGRLEILIREPETWIPGKYSRSPLQFIVDPQIPSLEQFWEGSVSFNIIGPKDHQLSCQVSLLDKTNTNPLVIKILPPIKLPFNELMFEEYFEKHIQNNNSFQKEYDLSTRCEIKLDGRELGNFLLRCDRAFVPLRWIIRNSGQKYSLNLLDDTGENSIPEVYRLDFEKPDVRSPVKQLLCNESLAVPETGGLYLAQIGRAKCTIVIPPRCRTFNDLKLNPTIRQYPRTSQDLKKLIDLYELWVVARIPGSILASTQRRSVLESILRSIFSSICGPRWDRAESKFHSFENPDLERIWREASSNVQEEKVIGPALSVVSKDLSKTSIDERVKNFTDLMQVYRLLPPTKRLTVTRCGDVIRRGKASSGQGSPIWIAEFGLRLASAPETLLSWVGQDFGDGMNCLLKSPIVAKAARYLVLSMWKKQSASPLIGGTLYRGWEWN